MKTLALTFCTFATMLAGCIGLDGVVKHRAGYDMSCPAEQIAVVEIGRFQYGAEGCGKRQTYTCIAQTGQCIPDNQQKTDAPTSAAAPAK